VTNPLSSSQGRGTWLAAAVTLLALVVAALAIAPAPVAFPLLLIVLAYAWPGVRVARRVYGDDPAGRTAAWLVGPLWGYLVTSLVLLVLWLAGFRHPLAVLVAPALAAALASRVRPAAGWVAAPAFERGEVAAALAVIALVPVIVGVPFARVGEVMADGVAYRAYFTADFVWARAVVVELAKGDVPPVNPFLQGAALNYYWLPHLLSAAEYRAGIEVLSADRVLLVNGLALGVVFAGFLYGFVRHFVGRPPAAFVACLFAVLFVSFEGTYEIWRLWQRGIPLETLRNVNIDGVTRWRFQSVLVDGLQRLLLYQATHHAVAYAAGLSALLVATHARNVAGWRTPLTAGLLLAASLLYSSFSALLLAASVSLVLGVRLLAARQWLGLPVAGVLVGGPLAAAVGLSFALQYVDTSGGLVEFGLNRVAARNAWVVWLLSFGPLLPGALVGVWAARRLRVRVWPLLTLAVVCGLAYFYVDVQDHMHVYVAWRAGHLLIIVFATLLGLGWQWAAGFGPGVRRAVATVLVVGAALSLPTTVIDVFNSQDVENRTMGPGFRWTVLLDPGEVRALDWIRRETPHDAIVQVEPAVRGRDTWAYIPAFADRRMSAGLPISMVPLRKYEQASAPVTALFAATDASAACDAAARLRIDYLVVGAPERQAYPRFEPLLQSRPDLFAQVFDGESVAVYQLRGAARTTPTTGPPR